MNQKRPLVAFIRQGSLPIPRLIRNIRALADVPCDIVFVGAKRKPGLPKREVWQGIEVHRVGVTYELVGGRKPHVYFWGLLCFIVASHLWLFRHRPKVIHASDVEGMLACLIYKLVFPWTGIVYNVHDNFHQRYNVPRWAKGIMRAFEGILAKLASVTMWPDEGRLESMGYWRPKRSLVILNTPEDPGAAPLPQQDRSLRVFMVGWLDWVRGAKVAGELLEQIPELQMCVAGSGAPDVEAYVKNLPRTEFHGFVPHGRVLELARTCHVILAFYDPCTEINRNASPNKVGDGLALGRPVLINNEVAVSQSLVDAACAFAAPYHDRDSQVAQLRNLLDDRRLLEKMGQAARALYESRYDWELYRPQVVQVFRKLLGTISPQETSMRQPRTRRAA